MQYSATDEVAEWLVSDARLTRVVRTHASLSLRMAGALRSDGDTLEVAAAHLAIQLFQMAEAEYPGVAVAADIDWDEIARRWLAGMLTPDGDGD